MSGRGISVVIPLYNGDPFIGETLESVFAQSRRPDEIVVVDDCSTDGSVETVRAIAEASPVPIRLEVLAKNSGGPARPMNRGIEVARGDFIAVLDQDDLMTPRRLELALAAAQRWPDASLVCGDYVLFEDGRELSGSAGSQVHPELGELQYEGEPEAARLFGDEWLRKFFVDSAIQRSCSNHFFRKCVWERVGGYREGAGLASDYDFVVRAFGRGVVWLRERMFLKRVHSANACPPPAEMADVLWTLKQELASLTKSPVLRRAVAEMGIANSRRMRWSGRYREARRHAWPLFRFGRMADGASEIAKAFAAQWFHAKG